MSLTDDCDLAGAGGQGGCRGKSHPAGFAAVPNAETLAGVVPPPKVMDPPFELIELPGPTLIAPAPLASRSELSTTLSAFVVTRDDSDTPPLNSTELSARM